jgi:hypothetical protein
MWLLRLWGTIGRRGMVEEDEGGRLCRLGESQQVMLGVGGSHCRVHGCLMMVL